MTGKQCSDGLSGQAAQGLASSGGGVFGPPISKGHPVDTCARPVEQLGVLSNLNYPVLTGSTQTRCS